MTTGAVAIDNVNQDYNTAAAEQTNASEGPGFSETLKRASSSGKFDLDAIFETAALRYNLPVGLLKAVAKAESSFRPDATSKCGAMGIMQLMPGTAKALGVTDAYDPEQNIMGGAKYLRQMLDKFGGDVSLALAAYNAGPANVTKYGGIPPFNETQNYVKNVLGYMGGNAITAGTVTYSGFGPPVRTAGKSDDSSGLSAMAGNMSQMLLMKIIEIQMSALTESDDKKKKVF
ncbi:MAG: lytic transglycosylase domain-containing protein [Oscillospiraceae bacterium]|jgi:soluble lytic murein transglycosylase-like protein|nr:lytic transglycosylase domain-containing protein [Oscillospiraceae bacterium]